MWEVFLKFAIRSLIIIKYIFFGFFILLVETAFSNIEKCVFTLSSQSRSKRKECIKTQQSCNHRRFLYWEVTKMPGRQCSLLIRKGGSLYRLHNLVSRRGFYSTNSYTGYAGEKNVLIWLCTRLSFGNCRIMVYVPQPLNPGLYNTAKRENQSGVS